MRLSVLITTYNHEAYIAQALDSILMQQTDFDFDIVLVDDCSTDRTREIVAGYQARHPERFRLIMPDQSADDQGLRLFFDALQSVQSDYIAMLDGDDFWTSPHKLQKQVAFLDAHPSCSMCFHNVRCFYEDGSQPEYDYTVAGYRQFSGLADMVRQNVVAGCSPVLRRTAIARMPGWMYGEDWADWTIYLLCAQHGPVGYLDETLGAYRIHRRGMWSGHDEVRRFEMVLDFYTRLDRYTQGAHSRTIRAARAWIYHRIALAYELDGKIEEAKASIRQSYRRRRTPGELLDPATLNTTARLYLPALYPRLVALKRAIRPTRLPTKSP